MEPTVSIAQGALQGKVMTSRKGRRIHAFQGIPYAEPPVGDLRFQVRMEFFTFGVAFFIFVFV
jgi:carboxylesterase type B